MKRKFTKFLVILFLVVLVIPSTLFASNGIESNIVGSWETAIYLNNRQVLTRVEMDRDGDISIKLREFMEYLGYSVNWNVENNSVELKNKENIIKVYVNDTKCEKNGEEFFMEKPVYIENDYSYLPQAFLPNILGINILLTDKAENNNRVNGVYLSTYTEELSIVTFDNPVVEVETKNPNENKSKIHLEFAVAVIKQDIRISMDYAVFIKANENTIRDIVTKLLQDINYESLKNNDFMQEFSNIVIEEINKATNTDVVKHFYITDLSLQELK